MKTKIVVLIIVGVIVVSGGSFYAGTKFAKASGNSRNQNFTAMGQSGQFKNGGTGTRFGMGMGGATVGQIIGKDDKSITVKLADGGSKIVFFTDKTAVTKNASSSLADLIVNENVFVMGSLNSDGSINAQTIQLGSNMRRTEQ